MRSKTLMQLVLALGCGLVASIGINQAMSRPAPEAVVGETTEIVVAQTDIGMGDPLKPEVLKLEAWPKDRVPPGALTKIDETEGRRTRTKIFAGEPIIEPKLLAKGEDVSDAAGLIPKGFRVVSIRVDAVSGAASLIKPGDRVDVLVHLQENSSRGIAKTTTKTFLQHVKVFAVDDVFRRDEDGPQSIVAKTISLLVTPAQAELVTMASELGSVRLVMRSANDEENTDTPGTTVSDLRGDSSSDTEVAQVPTVPHSFLPPAPPPKAPEPTLAPPPPEPKPAPHKPQDMFKMVLLMGADERKEVDFENGRPVNPPERNSTDSAPPANEPSAAATDPSAPDSGRSDTDKDDAPEPPK